MCQGDTLSDHSFTAEIHTTYLTKWDSVGSNLAKRSRKEHYRQQRKKKDSKRRNKDLSERTLNLTPVPISSHLFLKWPLFNNLFGLKQLSRSNAARVGSWEWCTTPFHDITCALYFLTESTKRLGKKQLISNWFHFCELLQDNLTFIIGDCHTYPEVNRNGLLPSGGWSRGEGKLGLWQTQQAIDFLQEKKKYCAVFSC